MKRRDRSKLAKETLAILDRGDYIAPGGARVLVADAVRRSLEGTVLFTPEELDQRRAEFQASGRQPSFETRIEVGNETTLGAARRLVVDHGCERVLCFNFASAKNAGGGFLGGSQAQEESLARSSGLYPTLTACPAYYQANRSCHSTLYTDHMILSPDVPVFRCDDGTLLAEPYQVSILTAPAANAGAVRANAPQQVPLIHSTMARRIANVLTVATFHGYEHLVLGAWGCGVFRNKPADVAALFAEALLGDGPYAGAFRDVVFAVLDRTADSRIIGPFEQCFLRPV